MRVSFLPIKAKKELEKIVGAAVPVSVTRASESLDGGPGESYVVAYDNKLVVLSRSLGQHDYSVTRGDLADDVKRVSLEKKSPSTIVLSLDIGGKTGELKFSAVEENDLAAIVEGWRNAVADATPDDSEVREASSSTAQEGTAEEPVPDSLPPIMAMAAALMYVSAVDGEVAKEENRYIANLRGIDKEGLSAALAYYRSHSFDELLQTSLSNLTKEQSLCVLANMLEVGMVDGVLHKSEIVLVKKFAAHSGIDKEEYAAVKQVLVVKNKISVLFT